MLQILYTRGYLRILLSTPIASSDVAVKSHSPSALGLGCVTFGREVDRTAAFGMMDYALRAGLTLFDTAAAYGGGNSETIVGEWITSRNSRDHIRLATKLLPPYSAAGINAALETSLTRLRVESVDILFLHRWDESAMQTSVLETLHALAQSGRVRQLGASNFDRAQLERAIAQQSAAGLHRFSELQNIHNYAVRSIDPATQALCASHGVSIMTYSPLGAGFLTGKHDSGVLPGSRFSIIPGHQDIYFTPLARARLARLQVVAARTGLSTSDLALSWATHQAQIATVLVGGRSPAQLASAVRARSLDIGEILAELDAE